MKQTGPQRRYSRRKGLRSSRMVDSDSDDDVAVVIGEKHGRDNIAGQTIDLTADDANPAKLLRSDDHVGLVATIAEDDMMQTKTVARKCDEDELEDATCPVCRGLLYRPVTLECGHNLCESCMFRWMSVARGSLVCPAGCQQSVPPNLPQVSIILSNLVARRFPGQTKEREIEVAPLVAAIQTVRRLQEAEPVIAAHLAPPAGGHPHHPPDDHPLFLPLVNLPVIQREQVKRTIDRLVAMNRVRFLVSLAISVALLIIFNLIGRFNVNPSFAVTKTIQQQWNSNLTMYDVATDEVTTGESTARFYHTISSLTAFGHRTYQFQDQNRSMEECNLSHFIVHKYNTFIGATVENCSMPAYHHIAPGWVNVIFPRASFIVDLIGLARTERTMFVILGTLLIKNDLLRLELCLTLCTALGITIRQWVGHPDVVHFYRITRLLLACVFSWILTYASLLAAFVIAFACYRVVASLLAEKVMIVLFCVRYLYVMYNFGFSYPLVIYRINAAVIDGAVVPHNQTRHNQIIDMRHFGHVMLIQNENVKAQMQHAIDVISIISSTQI